MKSFTFLKKIPPHFLYFEIISYVNFEKYILISNVSQPTEKSKINFQLYTNCNVEKVNISHVINIGSIS